MIVQTQKKVPALRFPGFEGEWRIKKLQQITTSVRSGKSKKNSTGEFDVYGSTGIIGKTDNPTHSGEYILVARVGANAGQINVAKGEFGVTDNTLIVELSDSVFLNFLKNFLIGFNLNRLVFGSGQPLVTGSLLKKIKIPLPSLPEQQKIAAFLTAIDTRIQQLIRKVDLLEQYKKGVMQKIFAQEIRFKPDSQAGSDGQGRDFPAWEEKRLGSVFKFLRTNSYSRNQLNYEKGEVKNIHYGDIHTKFKTCFDLSQEDVPFINEDIDLSRITEDDFCRAGDVIFADASEDYKDIGKAIEIVKLDTNKLVAGLHTILARDNKNLMALGFKGFLMQSRMVRLQIMRLSAGAKVLGISKTNLAEVNIYLPSLPEQQKIADFLTAIDRKITHTKDQLEHMQRFKKGLLQQMFV